MISRRCTHLPSLANSHRRVESRLGELGSSASSRSANVKAGMSRRFRCPLGFARSFALASLLMASNALGVPVYLEIESRYPTGQIPRIQLEEKTDMVQLQRWIQVRSGSTQGWLPETALLTSLDLASVVRLRESAPARLSPELEGSFQTILRQGQTARLVGRRGSWALLDYGSPTRAWVPRESLIPETQVGPTSSRSWAFAQALLPVFRGPAIGSRLLAHIGRFEKVSVLSRSADFALIEWGPVRGYAPIKLLLTSERSNEALVRESARLRAAPLPFADDLGPVRVGERVSVLASQVLRWGRADLRETGRIWWPIAEGGDRWANDPVNGEPRVELSYEQLLLRPISARIQTDARPGFEVVSADGVFVTFDGRRWRQINQFGRRNYPLAATPNGTIFVGPHRSRDFGDTFEQWVRWDRLVAALKPVHRQAFDRLQVLAVMPRDSDGQVIDMRMQIHGSLRVLARSRSGGLGWSVVSVDRRPLEIVKAPPPKVLPAKARIRSSPAPARRLERSSAERRRPAFARERSLPARQGRAPDLAAPAQEPQQSR